VHALRRIASSAIVIVVCVLFVLTSCNLTAAASEVQDAIMAADSRVQSAYTKVFLAEQAGANVSELLPRLNSCTSLLSQAKMSYRVGNSTGALSLAEQCITELQGIEAEAQSLHDKSVSDERQRIVISSAISAVAIVAVVTVFVLGWRFFKKRHLAMVMRMKLEVQADEPR
jgi:hypothetical protein